MNHCKRQCGKRCTCSIIPAKSGLMGSTGLIGPTGLTGVTGLNFQSIGNTGLSGNTGLIASSGFQGSTGLSGVCGDPGLIGATGLAVTGCTGLTGNTGVRPLVSYGSAYATTNQMLATGLLPRTPDQFVTFDPVPGPLNNMTLVSLPVSGLQLSLAGDYEAIFTATTTTVGTNSLSLVKNFSSLPVDIPNSVFGSNSNEITGAVQFTALPNDIISLVNNGPGLTLQSPFAMLDDTASLTLKLL